jgi:dipeptide/tripeptide permease
VTVPIIIFHIIVIILFYIKQKNKIDNKIKDIAFSINNWYLVKADERKKREIERKRLEKIIKNKFNS